MDIHVPRFVLCVRTSQLAWVDLDLDVEEIYGRRHVASLPASSIFQKYDTITAKQLLIHYTSTSGSLNFGMIIVYYFLVAPKFIQFCFKYVNRFCMHNTIRQQLPSLPIEIDVVLRLHN